MLSSKIDISNRKFLNYFSGELFGTYQHVNINISERKFFGATEISQKSKSDYHYFTVTLHYITATKQFNSSCSGLQS